MEPNEADRERAEALTSRGNSVHTRADQSVFQVLADEFAAHRIAAEQTTRAAIIAKLQAEKQRSDWDSQCVLELAIDLIEKGA